MKKLRQKLKKIPDAVMVFVVACLALWDAHLVFLIFNPMGTWGQFFSEWGTPLSIAYTVVLATLISLIPSRFEKDLKFLEDRIQSPISSFTQVVNRAEVLLKDLGNKPNTEFMLVSASPALGLELDDAKRREWQDLLASRIAVDDTSCKTSIVCLNPYPTAGSSQSALGEFCKVLADSLGPGERVPYDVLFNRGRKGIEDFQAAYANRKNFTFKFGSDPPCQVIIARDEKGNRKSIFYLSSTSTLRRGLPPSGFYTEESRMGDVLDHVFQYVSGGAADPPEDSRTLLQRDRDFQLQMEAQKHAEDSWHECPQIAAGFKLLVKKGVFPPDIALAADDFAGAVEQAADLVWKGVPEANRVGIDVGTGTGILALLLAKYCPLVIATDIGEAEIENAKENFQRYNGISSTVRVEARRGSLLETVTLAEAGGSPLIVFNHPYYPSPSNVFSVGGPNAGLACIAPFLKQAKDFVANGGGVVMPYAKIAGRHNPYDVAMDLDYKAGFVGTKHEHPKYGTHRICLFTLTAR
jgi:release factor glutamine methyltransferase